MNKRGLVFTTIAVILISILILMFLIQSNRKTEFEITKSSVQVETLNSFVKSMKTELVPNAIKVSSNQAILALIDYMDRNDIYLDDSKLDIANTVLSGNDPQGSELPLMFPIYEEEKLNYTINSTLEEIKLLATLTDINFTFEPFTVEIAQKDSWTLKITLVDFSFEVSSLDKKVKWIDVVDIHGEIPITNFRDPIILNEEDLNMTIQKADMTNYYYDQDDLDKIEQQMLNHTFNNNSDAPSFLQRLENDFTENPDGYGIEYIVNPLYNDNTAGYSLVDHHYYTQTLETCHPPIDGHDFFMEEGHLKNYGILPNTINGWPPCTIGTGGPD